MSPFTAKIPFYFIFGGDNVYFGGNNVYFGGNLGILEDFWGFWHLLFLLLTTWPFAIRELKLKTSKDWPRWCRKVCWTKMVRNGQDDLFEYFAPANLQKCVGGFLLYIFWRIFPGIFLEDFFSGHFFPQKWGDKIRRQNPQKNLAAQK